MIAITLLGTGGPIPDAHRAGPATLVSCGDKHYLADAGRGALMRLAAVGLRPPHLTAVLLTHLHSDHITDFNDASRTTTTSPARRSSTCWRSGPSSPTAPSNRAWATASSTTAHRSCSRAIRSLRMTVCTSALQRMLDTIDYHSSPEQAAGTAARAGVGTLVPPGGAEEYRILATPHFAGRIEVGDDLHRIEIS